MRCCSPRSSPQVRVGAIRRYAFKKHVRAIERLQQLRAGRRWEGTSIFGGRTGGEILNAEGRRSPRRAYERDARASSPTRPTGSDRAVARPSWRSRPRSDSAPSSSHDMAVAARASRAEL